MLSVVVIVALLLGALDGGVERDRERQLRLLAFELVRIQKGPLVEFRLVNRSGRPLDAVLLYCASDPKQSRSFWDFSRLAGPYGVEPTLLHRQRWPEPFVLQSITLVRGKEEVEHPLNFTCQPGGRVLVVVDEKGQVSARENK